MPVFHAKVTIDLHMLVVADDPSGAYFVAKESVSRALENDDGDVDVYVRGEVTSTDALPQGWDNECIPYGGDGDTTLRELFTQSGMNVPEPRCTKTLEMF